MRTILITGTRGEPDHDARQRIDSALFGFDLLIVGDASGVDRAARELALYRGMKVRRFEADWKGIGKGAGLVRNKAMVDEAARLLGEGHPVEGAAFPSIHSKGTWHCIRIAVEAGIVTTVELIKTVPAQGSLL